MSGFFSRWKEGIRGQLRKRETSPAQRFLGLLYVLMALAGFGLVAFAPTPRLTPVTVGFLALPAGLLIGGLTDLIDIRSVRVRVALRLASLALLGVGLLTLVIASVMPGG